MKIIYEIGDSVCVDHGGPSYLIVHIRKNGFTVENREGERFFFGKLQVEPTAFTIMAAKITTEQKIAESVAGEAK